MRTFYALTLPAPAREAVRVQRDRAADLCARGRYIPPENFHLTLHFLGEQTQRDVEALLEILYAARGVPPAIAVDHWGGFPSRRGSTLYLGVRPDPGLTALHRNLAAALREDGYRTDSKKFRPHITVGRNVLWTEPSYPCTLPFRLQIHSMALMETLPGPHGVRYRPLGEVFPEDPAEPSP